MPPELSNLMVPVLTGAVILFIVAYIGNMLSFSNRFVNALVTVLSSMVEFSISCFPAAQNSRLKSKRNWKRARNSETSHSRP